MDKVVGVCVIIVAIPLTVFSIIWVLYWFDVQWAVNLVKSNFSDEAISVINIVVFVWIVIARVIDVKLWKSSRNNTQKDEE